MRLVARADNALVHAELDAVVGAKPTPGADKVITTAGRAGMSLAIVSNNSTEAIETYLAQHDLAGWVPIVVGRTYGHPELMKPNPHPLTEAASLLRMQASRCVLVGDSVTDIVAARAAGMMSIGFANRPAKVATLREAGADVVTGADRIADIADALQARAR